MFTRKDFMLPQNPTLTGTPQRDIELLLANLGDLKRTLGDILRDFNTPGTLFPTSNWTPALTCVTPGDLAVTYSVQQGRATPVGPLRVLSFVIVTSAWTHTTASGAISITGVPVTSANISNQFWTGSLQWSGITKANYTQVTPRISGNSVTIELLASGSAQAASNVAVTDMPTGGAVSLRGSIVYQV